MKETVLELRGVSKNFGGLTAVDDLSLEVNEGDILGLIGPNGAGKTTVFNCIMGTHNVDDGGIYFREENIHDLRTYQVVNKGIARVSQHANPVPGMTVMENIRINTLPNSIFSFSRGASPDRIRELATEIGLAEYLDSTPSSLPHAFRRRLEIAKAMATQPDLLLLDEPFAGLNQREMDDLATLMRSYRDDGITIAIIDHNMRGLMALVERVVVMNNGYKLTEGPPDEVVSDPQVQDAYLAGWEGDTNG